jgi:hypothetical protein
VSVTKSTLDERIREASISVAKSAIGSPYIYPQYGRLTRAKSNLEKAEKELAAARAAWEDLIKDAPPEWKKLAPQV